MVCYCLVLFVYTLDVFACTCETTVVCLFLLCLTTITVAMIASNATPPTMAPMMAGLMVDEEVLDPSPAMANPESSAALVNKGLMPVHGVPSGAASLSHAASVLYPSISAMNSVEGAPLSGSSSVPSADKVAMSGVICMLFVALAMV